MNTTNPIIINEQVYDKYTVSLAFTNRFDSLSEEDHSMALTLTPTRIEDGNVHQSHENNKIILFNSKNTLDEIGFTFSNEIENAIKKLIISQNF